MPVFAASKKALGTAGVAVIGGAMLAAQMTGIFGTLVASSRLMHAMSKGGAIPSWFGRLNRDGTPANAVLFVICVSFVIPFFGRTVTGWPVDVSNLGAAVAYGYTSAAAFALSRKETGRAAFAGMAFGIVGVAMAVTFCLLILVPNYISGDSLAAESYLVLAVWCLAGFLQYRHVFLVDWLSRFGHSVVVWISILVLIFFSSLMWVRLAVYDASEAAFGSLVGKTINPDAQPFDIVLTDMWMPEMDGEGLVKAIRASGRLKSLPVYVVTADVEMQKRFRDVGFTGILLKPVTVATIGPVLADTAERRS